MSNTYPSIKLGEILIMAEILRLEDLNASIESAQISKLPVGRELVMRGYLTENVLASAVKLQSMVKDKILDVESAILALKIANSENLLIDDALKKAGYNVSKTKSTARLGELLIESGLLTTENLDQALHTSRETGLPLGRVLVLTKKITHELLSAALTAQIFIRDEKITREQAIKSLNSAKQRSLDFEKSLSQDGLYQPPNRPWIKLGELLVNAHLLSENDLLESLEISLLEELALGEVLVRKNLISQSVLSNALEIQQMVANRTLSLNYASSCLNQVANRGVSLETATAELGLIEDNLTQKVKFIEMLKVCNIANEDTILQSMKKALNHPKLLGDILINAGIVDPTTLNSLLRCQFLVNQGFINVEHAVLAMNVCRQKNINFDSALKELGWIK